MPNELFEKQHEGYIIKKIEIPKQMQSQADHFWKEIENHQFCSDRRKKRTNSYSLYYLAQVEVNIIKTIEVEDFLRFYDYYISPH